MVQRLVLEELISQGLSSRQIAIKLGKSQTTIRYWISKYQLDLASKSRKQSSQPSKLCLNCNNTLQSKDYRTKFCSPVCGSQHQQKQYIDRWLRGDVDGRISGGTLISSHIRNYLLEKADYKCSECGWSKVNPFTKKVPLEINHVDGNFLNNSPDNLEVLCPNCHALKHTYQNRGEGRRAKGYMK